jgi:2-polyprenyl-6-methoxyphenol hydroxylase-like FAD-dependent oxidoreductase
MAIENNDEPTVVIAGGGPCGMLTAILLSDEDLGVGINTIVLERAPEPDEWSTKSYTIVLGDNGKSCLERGKCLAAATEIGRERKCVYFFDGTAGTLKKIPKKSPAIGLSRPTLVRCLEDIASKHPRITVRRGAGVSKVVLDDLDDDHVGDGGVNVHLEDGTVISASHAVGADGKWSKVRQSFSELESQASIKVEPSFGVHMMISSFPDGWAADGTYVVKPDDKYKFYIIAAPMPSHVGGLSVSIVCYDETVELYPWLAPPDDMKSESYGKGGWEDEYSAMPDYEGDAALNLSEQLGALLQEAVPAFYNAISADDFKTARINRRVSWLDMAKVKDAAGDDKEVTYTTSDGLVTLLGDAAHAMVPTMGEGCNTALQSAVKLADAILLEMKTNEMDSCTREAISNAFLKYGTSRHQEVAAIQVMSAARTRLKKA